jgi:dihydrodipicolinate synthase/N-acetylneuraminate lyase
VYLFPERSGIDVSPEELAQLTSIDGVRAAKLSGRPNNHFDRYVQLAAPGSLIYSGDDSSYPAVVAAGGAGIVSGVSSAFPEIFGALTRVLKTEDQVAVTEAQDRVLPVVQVVGPTITRLTYAMATRYAETWNTRMPLPAVSSETKTLIDALLATPSTRPSEPTATAQVG